MLNILLPSRSLTTILALIAVTLSLLTPIQASRPDIKWMAGGLSVETDQSFAFSSDGQYLAVGDYPYLKLWRVSDGSYVRTLKTQTEYWVGAPSFHSDGSKVLLVGVSASVVSLVDGSEILRLKIPGESIEQAVFIPGSGNILAMDSQDNLYLLNGTDGSVIHSAPAGLESIRELRISRSGQRFALIGSTPNGNVVRVYDLPALSAIRTVSAGGNEINSVDISPDGNRLLMVNEFNRVLVLGIDIATTLGDFQYDYYVSAQFMSDNKTILTSTYGKLKAINIDDPTQTSEWQTTNDAAIVVSPITGMFAAFSGDGYRELRFYQLGSMLYRSITLDHAGLVSTDYSPSGQVVSASDGNTHILARNALTGTLFNQISRYYFNTTRAKFVDDIRVVSLTQSGQLVKWHFPQNIVESIIDSPAPLNDFGLNRQRTQAGGWISIGSSDYLATVSMQGYPSLSTVSMKGNYTHPPVFDSNFVWLYTYNGALVQIHRYTGYVGKTFGDISDSAEEIALRNDDSLLATASSDGYVRIYRTSDGKCLHRLAGHLAPVRSVVFSPDGKYLVSSAYDDSFSWSDTGNGSVIVWRVSDGAMLEFYDEECQPGVTDIAFAPNGSQLTWVRLDGVTVTAAFHPPTIPLPNLSQTKQMPDQTSVVLNTCIGTYVGPGFLYVAGPEIPFGIRVVGAFDIDQQWNLQYRALRVNGVLGTLPTGERYLHSARVELLNDGIFRIVTMANKAISVQAPAHLQRANPVGMDVTGVYARTTGWVTAVAEDKSWITIWDGSKWKLPLVDADGNPGIRCYSNRQFTPYSVGEFVEVQGVITREESNGSIYPILHFDYSEQHAYKE